MGPTDIVPSLQLAGAGSCHGALKGLRKDKSADNLLRVLLMHLGCGHSLHEAAVRARQAQLAELSSVALWNRLKKSQAWLPRSANT